MTEVLGKVALKNRGKLLVAATAVAIAIATLMPQPDWLGERDHVLSVFPEPSIHGWIDLGENVLLYLPLGLALGLSGISPVNAVGAGAGLSMVFESLQFVVPGRDPSLSDVVANTAGALIGALLIRRRGSRGQVTIAAIPQSLEEA